MKKQLTYFILFLLPAMYSCLDTPDMTVGPVNVNMREKPSVTSGANTSSPADGTLLFTGEVKSVGKANKIFEKGFYWGYAAGNLTDSVFSKSTNFEPGTFSDTLYNVRGDTTIYWRAFARNDFGVDTGEIRSYKTPPVFVAKGIFTGLTRSNFTAFALNNNLYITCGYNNILFGDVWRYDGIQWRNDSYDIPGGDANKRRYAVAFTIDDSLAYVGTGQGLSGSQRIIFGDFYVFKDNGITRTWNETPIQTPVEMPRYEAVAFSLNNKGYVIGGSTENTVLDDVWKYSITNGIGSWTKMNPFPKPFYEGISFSNKERAFAGFGNNSDTNILWEYDAINDSWNEFAASPTYPEGGQAKIRSGVIIRDKIYLLDVTNIIWELDLTTKMYKQKSTLPPSFPLQNEQYMFSVGDIIYVGLGGTELFYRYYPLWDN